MKSSSRRHPHDREEHAAERERMLRVISGTIQHLPRDEQLRLLVDSLAIKQMRMLVARLEHRFLRGTRFE